MNVYDKVGLKTKLIRPQIILMIDNYLHDMMFTRITTRFCKSMLQYVKSPHIRLLDVVAKCVSY